MLDFSLKKRVTLKLSETQARMENLSRPKLKIIKITPCGCSFIPYIHTPYIHPYFHTFTTVKYTRLANSYRQLKCVSTQSENMAAVELSTWATKSTIKVTTTSEGNGTLLYVQYKETGKSNMAGIWVSKQ